jgi:hypothetical protein
MSYKLRADQIRTIDATKYRFSVNGKEWNSAEEMLEVRIGVNVLKKTIT